tara:strand:- start:243 stop:401 length:159 start_codon:yes stop_codon:yes gene_type:complete
MVTREDFEAYEEVREEGMYNMFSPDAILMSGLDKKTYLEIMQNYSKLKEKFE